MQYEFLFLMQQAGNEYCSHEKVVVICKVLLIYKFLLNVLLNSVTVEVSISIYTFMQFNDFMYMYYLFFLNFASCCLKAIGLGRRSFPSYEILEKKYHQNVRMHGHSELIR